MFGLKKKEKPIDEFEVKAIEIMDRVEVPDRMRKGIFSLNKYFKLAAEELFENEEPLAYILVTNLNNNKLGSVLILTNKRILSINDLGIGKSAESIPLKNITSIENSKYDLAIKTAAKDYFYRDTTGDNTRDFAKVIKQQLFE